MGIDYDGGMIVGEKGENLVDKINDIDFDWIDDNGMVTMSTYFDCNLEDCYIGFSVDNIEVEDINNDWVKKIHTMHHKFKELTGVPAKLIGTQNIR